ncbi:MAG: hypothetical protein J6B34_01600 [Clostridia bacterium]|nr:hypothetical protein [Clostridia bacterium]
MEKGLNKALKITIALLAILLLGVIGSFFTVAGAQDANESYYIIEMSKGYSYSFYHNGYQKGKGEIVEFSGTYILTGEASHDITFKNNNGEAVTYDVILHGWQGVSADWYAMICVEENVTLNLYAYGSNRIIGDNHPGIKTQALSGSVTANVNLTVAKNAEVEIGYSHDGAETCVSDGIVFTVNDEAECSADLTGEWKEEERVIFKRGETTTHSLSATYVDEGGCQIKCDGCEDLTILTPHSAGAHEPLDASDADYNSKHRINCQNCNKGIGTEEHKLKAIFYNESYHYNRCTVCNYKSANQEHNINGLDGCVDCEARYELSHTVNGETKYYFKSSNAQPYIESNGGIVALVNNVNGGTASWELTRDTTIDLCGFELEGVAIVAKASVTVKDSSEEKTGLFDNTSSAMSIVYSKLSIEGINLLGSSFDCYGGELKIEDSYSMSGLYICTSESNARVEIRDCRIYGTLTVDAYFEGYNQNAQVYNSKMEGVSVYGNMRVNQLLPSGYAYADINGKICDGSVKFLGNVTVVEHTHDFSTYKDLGTEHILSCICGEKRGEAEGHEMGEEGFCAGCGMELCVTVINGESQTHLVSIENAFSFADKAGGGLIRLNSDAILKRVSVNDNITFDLNGYTLRSEGDRMSVNVGGSLVICDSSKDKTGEIFVTDTYIAVINVSEGAQLTINGGEIAGIIYTDYCHNDRSTIVINDGKFTNPECFKLLRNATVIINGGLFYNKLSTFYYIDKEVSITLNGGAFINPILFDLEFANATIESVSQILGTLENGCELALLDEYGNEITVEQLEKKIDGKVLVAHKGATVQTREGGHVLNCATCNAETVVLEHGDIVFEAKKDDGTSHNALCNVCKGVLLSENHTGGEANCTTLAECEKCNATYGELDSDNHTGGRATCTSLAVCERCQKSYGVIDASNHTTTNVKLIADGNKHNRVRECCETIIEALDHKYDGVCDASCNDCGEVREIAHKYNTEGNCILCGAAGGSVKEPIEAEKGVGAGAIVGTVIGTIAFVGIGDFALIWFVFKRKSWADLLKIFKK